MKTIKIESADTRVKRIFPTLDGYNSFIYNAFPEYEPVCEDACWKISNRISECTGIIPIVRLDHLLGVINSHRNVYSVGVVVAVYSVYVTVCMGIVTNRTDAYTTLGDMVSKLQLLYSVLTPEELNTNDREKIYISG